MDIRVESTIAFWGRTDLHERMQFTRVSIGHGDFATSMWARMSDRRGVAGSSIPGFALATKRMYSSPRGSARRISSERCGSGNQKLADAMSAGEAGSTLSPSALLMGDINVSCLIDRHPRRARRIIKRTEAQVSARSAIVRSSREQRGAQAQAMTPTGACGHVSWPGPFVEDPSQMPDGWARRRDGLRTVRSGTDPREAIHWIGEREDETSGECRTS